MRQTLTGLSIKSRDRIVCQCVCCCLCTRRIELFVGIDILGLVERENTKGNAVSVKLDFSIR